jgi:hypothetical protein
MPMPLGADEVPSASAEQEKARFTGLFFRAGRYGALVSGMLFFPLAGIAIGIAALFGVGPRSLGTFGGELSLPLGLLAWWSLLLVPSMIYAALVPD